MSFEIEQKYSVASLDQLAEKLTALGCQELQPENQVDTYLRHCSRDFRATDEALRLRRINDRSVITYKGPRLQGPMKTRPEIELDLVPGTEHAWLEIWQSLGFQVAGIVRKFRRGFSVVHLGRSATIALDDVDQIGSFVEVEVVVADIQQIAKAQQDIEFFSVWLDLVQIERRSYLSMMLEKNNSFGTPHSS